MVRLLKSGLRRIQFRRRPVSEICWETLDDLLRAFLMTFVNACFDILKTWNFGFVHRVLTSRRRQEGSLIAPLRSLGVGPFLQLSMLVAQGQNYLSRQEYVHCLKRAERQYFVWLVRLAFPPRNWNRDLWNLYKKGLLPLITT